MGYDRNDCYMTCGERDDRCAALGIDDPFSEIDRLRALIMLGDFSSLRPNSDSFKLVQQIRRDLSHGKRTLDR